MKQGFILESHFRDFKGFFVVCREDSEARDKTIPVFVFEAGEVEEIKAGLKKAIETIHLFHEDVVWDLYQSSPEMKKINKALAILEGDDE